MMEQMKYFMELFKDLAAATLQPPVATVPMAPPGTPTTDTGLQPPHHTAAPTAVTLNLKEAGPPQPTQATLEERFKHPEATVHVVCGGGKSPRQELIVPKATALQLAEPKR